MPSHRTEISATTQTASGLLRALRLQDAHAIWETSSGRETVNGVSRQKASRVCTIALFPQLRVELRGGLLEIRRGGDVETHAIESGEQLVSLLRQLIPEKPTGAVGDLEEILGGLIGSAAYDLGRYFERIEGATGFSDEAELLLFQPSVVVELYTKEQKSIVYGDASDERVRLIENLLRCPVGSSESQQTEQSVELDWKERFSKSEFMQRVNRAREYIAAGDIFQVVLANSFCTPAQVDALAAYDFLKANNQSLYHFLLSDGCRTTVGASPEMLLRLTPEPERTRSVLQMRLVAGTYPKHEAEQLHALGSDRKELAEHLMLVDHARNDIGRVAEIGSVEVTDLFSIEEYRDVHHIVSQVSGLLSPKENPWSAFFSCFPIATLTGTPKIRAMEIIAELESKSRGIFGGALLRLSRAGLLDSTVAIRLLVTSPEGTRVQAGAGIVYDSNPEREYEECRWKAQALFAAVEQCRLR